MLVQHLRGVVRAVSATALVLVLVPSALAQVEPDAGRWEPERIRQAIEARYRVVPLQDGVALVPRSSGRQVQSIEISGGTVAIDGNVVTGRELREQLGADSEAILALSYLDPDTRKSLFQEGRQRDRTRPDATRQAPGTTRETPGTQPEARSTDRERRRHSDARIRIGGGIHVAEHETVDGPVVAVGGPVTVDGEVREDVVAVGGSVTLGPKARVRGDVTSVGGSINRDEQAEVGGGLNEVAFRFPRFRMGPGIWLPAGRLLGDAFGPGVEMVATGFRMLLFGLLAMLGFLAFRTPVERIERAVSAEPWKAGAVGLLTELLFIPVFVLTVVVLAVSIIGIPLLLFVPPLVIVGLIIALVAGFAGVAYRLGRWVIGRFGWGQGAFGALLVGLAGIWALTILGRLVSFGAWPMWSVAAALLTAGFLVEYVAWTVGLGAAVMTRLGTRESGGRPFVPPPPPAVGTQQAGGAA